MGFVVLCGAAIMGLHAYIVHKFPQQRVPTEIVAKAQRLAQRRRQQEQQRQSLGAADVAPSSAGGHLILDSIHCCADVLLVDLLECGAFSPCMAHCDWCVDSISSSCNDNFSTRPSLVHRCLPR